MDFADGPALDSFLSDSDKRALELFNAMVAKVGQEREAKAEHLADILGNSGEFGFYLGGTEDQRLIRTFHLLRVFRENVELLAHKTWVTEADEKTNQILFEDLRVFIEDYRGGRMGSAFRRFVSIARVIPTFFFGSAGRAPDFLEYAFRMDPRFGLFFWYVGELEKQMRSTAELTDKDQLFRLETLLGAYALSCI